MYKFPDIPRVKDRIKAGKVGLLAWATFCGWTPLQDLKHKGDKTDLVKDCVSDLVHVLFDLGFTAEQAEDVLHGALDNAEAEAEEELAGARK